MIDVSKLKDNELRQNERFETDFGIPYWLARLNNRISKRVSPERSKLWPVEFSESISEGADLDKVNKLFLIFIVESAKALPGPQKVKDVCEGVLVELRKDVIDVDLLEKARTKASAFCDYFAADAAALADYDSIWHAATAAAFGAGYNSDSRTKAFEKFADKLLELLRECK